MHGPWLSTSLQALAASKARAIYLLGFARGRRQLEHARVFSATIYGCVVPVHRKSYCHFRFGICGAHFSIYICCGSKLGSTVFRENVSNFFHRYRNVYVFISIQHHDGLDFHCFFFAIVPKHVFH